MKTGIYYYTFTVKLRGMGATEAEAWRHAEQDAVAMGIDNYEYAEQGKEYDDDNDDTT